VFLCVSQTSVAEYLPQDNVFMCFRASRNSLAECLLQDNVFQTKVIHGNETHDLCAIHFSSRKSFGFYLITKWSRCRDSSVVIERGCGLDDLGSIPGRDKNCFSTPQRPHRLLGPPSLLSNWYRALFPWGLSDRGEADHSPPSSAMIKNAGATPPFPNVSSRHSA
jgi:hypothetical protein